MLNFKNKNNRIGKMVLKIYNLSFKMEENQMRIEKENLLMPIVEKILAYPDKTVSDAFEKLTDQNKLILLMTATEELHVKIIGNLNVDLLLNMVSSIQTENIHYNSIVVEGVYTQILENLELCDTTEDIKQKESVLISIYNAVRDEETKRILLERLELINVDVVAEIRANIVDEWTIFNTNDSDIQRLMREVDMSQLAIFLGRQTKELREVFYRNMSRRLEQMIREDIQAIGELSDTIYKKTYNQIVQIYKKLAEAGEIKAPRRS